MELDAAISLFAESSEKLCKTIDANIKPPYKPIYGKAFGFGIVDAAGDNLLLLPEDGPSAGRVWNILQVGVWGGNPIDPIVAVTTTKCAIYIGPSGSPDYSNVSNMIVRIPSGQIPTITQFSKDVLWAHSNERVYAWINGGTAAIQFVLVVWYADYPVEAVEALYQ